MKKFTEILGGRVDVKSELGRRSTFLIRLPVGAVSCGSDSQRSYCSVRKLEYGKL